MPKFYRGSPSMSRVDDMGAGPARRAQLRDWRSFLQAHAHLVRRLEADLLADGHPPLAMYDVLVQLVEAPGRRLRMTELADAVLLSRSGLSRLVSRMQTRGYVVREPSPGDARGVYAVATGAGVAALRAASRTHLSGVSAYVIDRLSPDELAAFGAVCRKLLPEA